MSKKDYELIARALKDNKPHTSQYLDWWFVVVIGMVEELEKDNPRFNRAKFLQACGYND